VFNDFALIFKKILSHLVMER